MVSDRLRWVIGAWLVEFGVRVLDAGAWEVWTQNYGSWDRDGPRWDRL